MTQKQWDANPDLQQKLDELLRDPVLVHALDLVYQQGLKPISPPTGCDIVQFGAMMGFKRDGYIEAVKNLRTLAQPAPVKDPGLKPWESPPQEKAN